MKRITNTAIRATGITRTNQTSAALLISESRSGRVVTGVTHALPSKGPSALWGEMWRRGCKIMEIHSEASNLEELYMRHTGRDRPETQEVSP